MKQVNVKTMRAVPQNGGDMYDCIVIGAGIAGAVAARKLAEEKESVSLSWNADRISGETVTMRKMLTAF